MSVSITEGAPNVDLHAIVTGGDAFIARVKELTAKKDATDKALADLKIGHSVVAALNDAQATQQAAKQSLEDAKAQAEKTIADANKQAFTIASEAKTKADETIAAAQKEATNLDAAVAAARKVLQDWSDKTRAEANAHLSHALEARRVADKLHADNSLVAKQLADERAKLKQALDDASAKQAMLAAKLEAIRAAAS